MVAAPTFGEWLREAPFALTMSSGFFGFFAHAGVLATLEDAGLRPVRVSGSSAGGLVTGLWAAGVDPVTMRRELLALRREHFWDPWPGFGLLRGRLFRDKLRALVGDRTIEAGRVPAAVSLYDVWRRRTVVREQGPVAEALVATCAVPVLFHPQWLDRRPYLDGGVLDRPGIAGMPAGTRLLYHHLASRSPWRRKGGTAMRIPHRPGLTALVVEQLPRLGPFRLAQAERAFDAAARAARDALKRPIVAGEVRIEPPGAGWRSASNP